MSKLLSVMAATLRKPRNTERMRGARFWWRNMPIRIKLPAVFVGFALLSIASVVTLTAQLNRATQLATAEEAFEVYVSNQGRQISTWLSTAKATLKTTAQGKQAIDALYGLNSAFQYIKQDGKQILQKAYIADNPNPAGSRQLFMRGEGEEFYHIEHARFHKTFLSITQEYGLYDVFLINRDGDVIYSVSKEFDFADNLRTGQIADTAFADVFEKAIAAEAGEVFISNFEPYGPSSGSFALFMATPIVSEMGATVGVMAVQLPDARNALSDEGDTPLGESSEIYIVKQDLTTLTASRLEGGFSKGEKVKDLAHIANGWTSATTITENAVLQSGEIGFAYTKVLETGGVPWLMVAERANSDIFSRYYELLLLQVSVAALSILLVGIIGVWVARGFTQPIAELNRTIKSVASGHYDISVPFKDTTNEIGAIAVSIEEMRKSLQVAQDLAADRAQLQADLTMVVDQLTAAMKNLADGDLSLTIDQPFPQGYEVLRSYFNDSVLKTRDSIQSISFASEGMRAQSVELTRAAEDLAHRTEVQAATLEETAAAMDQITSSVKSAADGIREVESIVVEARKDAVDCGVVVNGAVSAMAEIEKSSGQIGQIISVIDDIAFQTNLLALNAGVEAARAGDAGRGFAVVALEVGALAQRASTAAKEIKSLISTSTEQVERGVTQVQHAGTALQQIAHRVTQISSLTTNIATGAAEQALGLNEINVGVTHLDQSTQQNAAMAEQASAASQLMVSGTRELTDLVSRFKLPPRVEVHSAQTAVFEKSGVVSSSAGFALKADGSIVKNPDAWASPPQSEHAPAMAEAMPAMAANSGGNSWPHDAEQPVPRRAATASARGVWQDF